MTTKKIFINHQLVFVEEFSSVLQACSSLGIELPRFCYHPLLNIAGNCRSCLVEVSQGPKPQMSCAFPILGGGRFFIHSPLVRKARETVLEFNLVNHPLDCPICDQGGECDLQNQSFHFGSDKTRYTEVKRTVKETFLGLGIKSLMTRCIHCTRCVRYSKEWLGDSNLTANGRGSHMVIEAYSSTALTTLASGNLVDLCPIGSPKKDPFWDRFWARLEKMGDSYEEVWRQFFYFWDWLNLVEILVPVTAILIYSYISLYGVYLVFAVFYWPYATFLVVWWCCLYRYWPAEKYKILGPYLLGVLYVAYKLWI